MSKKSIKTLESELKEAIKKRDYYDRCARSHGGMMAAYAASDWQATVSRLVEELTIAKLG